MLLSLSVLDKCPLSPRPVLNAASLLCIPEVSLATFTFEVCRLNRFSYSYGTLQILIPELVNVPAGGCFPSVQVTWEAMAALRAAQASQSNVLEPPQQEWKIKGFQS